VYSPILTKAPHLRPHLFVVSPAMSISAYNTDATVSPSSTAELSLIQLPGPVPGTDDRHTEYIKLVGLPYNTSMTALKGFISDVKFYPVGKTIVRLKNATSGDSGKAMIRTESEAEARRCASLLHKRYLGWRYVEVYHIGEFEARSHNLPLDCDKPVAIKGSKKQLKRNKAIAKVNANRVPICEPVASATEVVWPCPEPTSITGTNMPVCTVAPFTYTQYVHTNADPFNANYSHYMSNHVNAQPFPLPVQRSFVKKQCDQSITQFRIHEKVGYTVGDRSKPQSKVFVHSPYSIVENSMTLIESE